MVTTSEVRVESQIEELQEKRPIMVVIKGLLRKEPVGAAGALIVLAMIIMAVFAPVLTGYDPELNSFEHMLTPPGSQFWLGTDQFGRDLFTRIVYGARTALFVGFTTAFIGATVGLVLGVMSAYFGGRFDLILLKIIS